MIEQELLTVTEKYEYEISTKEEIVKKLEIQYRRWVLASHCFHTQQLSNS